jgi:arabinogalactan endo-1,4-beta-galactosidase
LFFAAVLKMKLFHSGIFALLFAFSASGQILLYQEDFPYSGNSGNSALSSCGWSNAIPNNFNRLYQLSGTNGAVYAYQSDADVPVTTVFYTTTALDNGGAGMAFSAVAPAQFKGLTFSADVQPGYQPDTIAARFAVQMNGSNWLAAKTALPVPGAAGNFATYTQAFTPSASAWNTLTIRATNAVIGAGAVADLTGFITGAGLVFTHTAHAGTYNFDNFLITATVGSLGFGSISNGVLNLSWSGAGNIALQSTTNLSGTGWADETNTLGQSAVAVSLHNPSKFFRLKVQAAGGGVSLSQANLGFEADGSNTAAPQGWISTGSPASVLVNSNDAFAGKFSLLVSNAAAYQAQVSLLVTNLANGFYSLYGWTKNSGGQSACYLAGNQKMSSLPPLFTNWTPIVVRGINVTNGQCLVGLFCDASASNWCRLDGLTLTNDNIPYNFIKGGDVSELTYVEQGGGKFYETNGIQTDCLQILKNHGCNTARLRLYNDPGNTNYSPSKLLPPGIQSPANILALAARAKALGLQIELTFYYSDYWTNSLPHDWSGFSFPQLTNAVFSFTTNFLTQMKNQGTAPEYVSLGNEINTSFMMPYGSTSNFWQLGQLLGAGYAGVKSVSPSSQVILHLSTVDYGTVQWFLNGCISNGAALDIVGCSYYPFWTGLTTEQARTNINQIYSAFKKPVLVMETGYNWSTNCCDGWPGQLSNNGPEFFPSTPAGQKSFLLKCFNDLKLVSDGHCIGDLYWDPIFICVPGEGWQLGARNVVDNTTLFDFNGHALSSLDAFNCNN